MTEENTRYAAYGDVHEARRQVAEEVIKRMQDRLSRMVAEVVKEVVEELNRK